jgi:hypothetical protein
VDLFNRNGFITGFVQSFGENIIDFLEGRKGGRTILFQTMAFLVVDRCEL